MGIHESHGDIVKRLNRAQGHLGKVIRMIEEGRPCLDVAQQFQAVTKAMQNAKNAFIHDHIEHCLDLRTMEDPAVCRKTVKEFKELAKYL